MILFNKVANIETIYEVLLKQLGYFYQTFTYNQVLNGLANIIAPNTNISLLQNYLSQYEINQYEIEIDLNSDLETQKTIFTSDASQSNNARRII